MKFLGSNGITKLIDLIASRFAVIGHNHDGTYAASSHGNHVPTTETANNARFLRNDNTWQTVTPANIGASASDHTHSYLPLSGGTLTGDVLFSDSGTGTRQIRFQSGTNDYSRIAGGATATNGGWLEIATADDANEPIYVRQYSGTFNTISRTATLLDASGNTIFPGSVTVGSHGTIAYNSSTGCIEFSFV